MRYPAREASGNSGVEKVIGHDTRCYPALARVYDVRRIQDIYYPVRMLWQRRQIGANMENGRGMILHHSKASGLAAVGKRGKYAALQLGRFGTKPFRLIATLLLPLAICALSIPNVFANDGGRNAKEPEVIQQMQCGSHNVVIPCGKRRPGEEKDPYDPRVCVHNPLKFIDAKGREKVVSGFGQGGTSTESMVCGVGRGGRHYVEALLKVCGYDHYCGYSFELLEENGSLIEEKPEEREDDPDGSRSQDYDEVVAKNKIRFTEHPSEIVSNKQCGSHRVVITCGKIRPGEKTRGYGDPQVCVHNKLKFIDSRGGVRISKYTNSDSIDEYHPDSLICASGPAGEHYVQVRYTSYPTCGACEFFVLFAESGKYVESRPAARDHESSAAKRYDRLWGKRKIKVPQGD